MLGSQRMLESESILEDRSLARWGSGQLPLERLSWLIRLRWVALLGILCAAAIASTGVFPGVNWAVLFATAAGGLTYNAVMWRDLRLGRTLTDRRAAIQQALIDFL